MEEKHEKQEKQEHKSHHQRLSGKKVNRKKPKGIDENVTAERRNPKAFAFNSVEKAEKNFRRTMDIRARKHHIPLVDRTPMEPPPIVVAIVGPPKVGKTTLLKCLIKNFTRQKISSIQGPVTIVSGKQRRLTFIECNNDINNMIDIAKVADLVLLLVDASFGFEMEAFEFLNICQVHGFPRIMGVLTHLDYFKNNKSLRKTKKALKRRFWTEIYQGAKLFYLSGMVHQEYQKTEIHNLGRFISVMKFRPLTWKLAHPYVLADRMEDLTDPETIRTDSKCDRTVCLYGYSRGSYFKNRSYVHIPGCGDFKIHDMSFLPDPCPLPEKEKRRALNEKEKLIYAPMSGVGGIIYDKDAIYIDLKGSHSHHKASEETEEGSSAGMINSIMDSKVLMDEKIAESEMRLFSTSNPVKSSDIDRDDDNSGGEEEEDDDSDEEEGSDDEDVEGADNDDNCTNSNPLFDKPESCDKNESLAFADSDDDLEAENLKTSFKTKVESNSNGHIKNFTAEDSALRWKENLTEKAITSFYHRQSNTTSLRKLVYGDGKLNKKEESDDEETEEVGGLFKFSTANKSKNRVESDGIDSTIFQVDQLQDWTSSEVMDSIKDCFVSGKWEKSRDAQTLLKQDDELYGDFEDLENEEVHQAEEETEEQAEVSESEKEEDEENEENDDEEKKNAKKAKRDMTMQEKRMEKKRKLKEMFNAEYDDKDGDKSYFDDLKSELHQQAQLNKSEFENLDDAQRVEYEGFRPGMYVRIEIDKMPCEFVVNFDPTHPIVVGGLLSGEGNIGFVTVRLKKHRWYPKILKTRDPLILSLGWRRFQTMPLYTMQDHNERNRLLKYTPQHLHCQAHFWGPITPQNTGILAIQSVQEISDSKANFRISATGSVTEVDKSTNIVKKLKLTGTPFKILKKTCFIKVGQGMFSTGLEVAKFEGASIRTVSNIRGQIKKPVREPAGAFRATFEDKILMSGNKRGLQVKVPQFYNPVTTLLLPPEEKSKWKGMKTVGQLRREKGLKVPTNPDSFYKEIERPKKVFRPLVIPRALQKDLPYTAKPKFGPTTVVATAESKRIAVVRDPSEQKIARLIKSIRTMHSQKVRKDRITMRARVKDHKKVQKRVESKRIGKNKERTKEIYRALGRKETKLNKNKKED
ncbi:Ribosome biogenesis protein bms1 [Nymphon striatum]|nr:Ribosome biogenesis protein bms1 [Nymphon striatum]